MNTKVDKQRYLAQSGSNLTFYALLPKQTYVVKRAQKQTKM